MSILEVSHVSIRYMTGDFKDIGLKEYVIRRLKGRSSGMKSRLAFAIAAQVQPDRKSVV